ncbi:hydantoinase B/oxoprolinase family protein [Acuticoccus sp. I52.16.1]|uniref:hydantoinase B/oxoprolinase family protein n=1 Tax=Acuticoccus sp. I52.16.1 TaxID=2928472 RepID=UPI001FD14D78|nr:hydantoinase B/oxoprolinase family protein [Acuticoccus sp. I52.16.1]UOM32683.1 hydantoinase B/oxoprolinase family protein [Acuticoccus sp. I52.16.1]
MDATTTRGRLDPISRAVIQHRLSAIVEEMGEAMLRTAFSQILNASRDFSMGIVDRDCRLVAQADHIPVHVGALPFAVKALEARFGDDVDPGDVFILNDPYAGGSHLPDVTIFAPVFAEGERRLWAVARAHMGEIGGATHGGYNPGAREIWQEGLRIPPMKLAEKGKLRADVFEMLLMNVRLPREVRGDIDAMIGAAHLGERSLNALYGEFGRTTVDAAVDEILDGAETRARAIVAEWPDGTYEGTAYLDDDGRERTDLAIRAKVTVKGSDLTVDLTGTDDQTDSFVNSAFANTQAAVAMALAYLIDADIPKNDGVFRLLDVKLRHGSLVHPTDDAPVTLSTSHPSNEVVEAIVRALQHACPERCTGGWSRRFRMSITGENPRNGRKFIWHLFHARPGGGASPKGDGWPGAGEWHSVGGIKFGSIEVSEARFPLVFERHEFRPGSGGDGEYRGGVGCELDLRVEVPGYAHTAGEGVRHGSAGIAGGRDGAPHDYRLVTGEREESLRTKQFGVEIAPGSLVRVRSAGGGGWGDPEKRTDAARTRDAREGFTEA